MCAIGQHRDGGVEDVVVQPHPHFKIISKEEESFRENRPNEASPSSFTLALAYWKQISELFFFFFSQFKIKAC